MNLKGRDFLKLLDFSGEEITYLIDLAEKLKTLKKGRRTAQVLQRQKHCAYLRKDKHTDAVQF